MRRKDRALALLLAIGMTLCLLSACGQGGPAPSQTSAADASTAELSAQPTEAAAEPEQETASLPESSAEAEGSGEVPLEPPEDAEASPLTGSTVKGIDYPIGDPDDPTEFSLFSVWGMGFDEFLDSWNSLPRLEDIQAATGCRIRFHEVSQTGASEQFNLMIASGDMDDIIQAADYYVGGLGAAYDDEVIIDLSDMIEENAPIYYDLLMNHSNQTTRDVVLTDGKHLSMNTLKDEAVSDMGLVVRGDWLDELGFDTPTTVDELTDFLLACKDKYGLTNPYLVLADLNIGMNRAFNVKAEGNRMGYQLAEEGGEEIVWSGTTQNFRDYVEFLRNWYEIGIFNDDYLNISNQNGNVQSTYMAGNTAAWNSDCAALLDDSVDGVPVPDLKIYNDESTNISGITDQEKVAQTGHMMVFSSCERPETFLEFLDYFFTDEGNLLANWGVEDKTFVYDESGKPTYSDAVWADTDCFFFLLRSAKYGLYWAPCDFDVNLMIADYTPEQYEAVDMWVATRGSYLCYPPNFQLSTEDRDIVNQYENDCATYFWEHVYKVIAGQETMEDFDTAVQTALDMGMAEIVDAYNRSYQDYLAQNG